MKWLRNYLHKLIQEERQARAKDLFAPQVTAALTADEGIDHRGCVQFTVLKAMNGRMVRIGTYKHNPHGPDWTYELYIVPEGERIGDTLERLAVIKMLEK